jgi:hypothetical protein
MRPTPLIMMMAVLVEQHSETNAGVMITFVTTLAQPLYGAISVKADGRVSRGIAVNMGSAR